MKGKRYKINQNLKTPHCNSWKAKSAIWPAAQGSFLIGVELVLFDFVHWEREWGVCTQ